MSKSWRDALKKTTATEKSNPFELKFNKQKYDILNKAKPGAAVGKPGASKRKAEDVRKNTLLKEYKSFGRTSKVIDRRFGKGITDDDAVLQKRFSLAQSKKEATRIKYQLSDDDEAADDTESALTHKGQSLTTKNMNEYIDDDDVDIPLTADNFGGFAGDEKKSKAEIMKELISKSKYYKVERQRIKEENENIRGDIDASFDLIRKSLLNGENRRKGKLEEEPGETEFDSSVKQLVFERRLAAQNEVKKTPEEQEKLQLEKEFKKQQELKKRITGDASLGEVQNEEELLLSRKMLVAEKELRSTVDEMCKSTCIEKINSLYSQIIGDLSSSSHRQILLAKVCRDKISKLSKSLRARALAGSAVLNKPASILLLHLIGTIFSTCDFHHIVSTPAHLYGLYLLDYTKITKVKHAVYALWICQIITSYQTLSKRYIPEVMNALYSLCLFASKTTAPKECYYLVRPIACELIGDLEYTTSNILNAPEGISASSFMSALSSTVLQAAVLYRELAAFPEIFSPFVDLLDEFSKSKLSEMITNHLSNRTPLQLQDHKPVPLPQLEPFIEDDVLVAGKRSRKHTTNPQREIQNLKFAHKKELRSTQRELKKDSRFIAREQLKDKKAKDSEYQTRIGRLYGVLANEGANI